MATSIFDASDFRTVSDSVANLARSNINVMRPLIDTYLQSLKAMAAQATKIGAACCEIPETDCPPKYACTMRWRACPGDVRRGEIRINNTSKSAITYTLDATEFRGCQQRTGAKPTITPQSVTVAPSQFTAVAVKVVVDKNFCAGEEYESEVRIRGKYERCVRLVLVVEPCCDEVCEVDHGEIPTRIRADDWYRHFQCTELCFEPVPPLRPQEGKPTEERNDS